MVYQCVAFGCSNAAGPGITLFRFPKDASLLAKWTEQVKRTRDGWKRPTEHSRLCSAHFALDCFETSQSLLTSLGVPRKSLRLREGAIPSIFKRPLSSTARENVRPKRGAYLKRERARVRATAPRLITRLKTEL